MKYSVATFREAGLEARWTKTRTGAPIIAVKNPAAAYEHQRKTWWLVTKQFWQEAGDAGILEAFDSFTLMGDAFSLQKGQV